MAINQRQIISLQQKLSPQQIQMIKLLELPTVQLEQRIKQEIEDNIVLEEEERSPEEETEPQQISVEEYLREDDTPAYKSRINNYSKDDKQRPVFLTGGRSLQEYLVEQLQYRNLSERDMRLAVYLIGSIDEDGYLRRDLESVADDIAFSVGVETTAEELERLLGIIHELEPAGVGARNLRECLLLQMEQTPQDTDLLLRGVRQEALRETHRPPAGLRGGFPRGHRRDPAPVAQTGQPLRRGGHRHDALHHPRFHPRLPGRPFPALAQLLQRARGADQPPLCGDDPRHGFVRRQRSRQGQEAIQFVKSKIDSAKWFISAIKQRHDTLMRTMQTILDYQQEYFKDGDQSKLRPMILKDIADRTALDVSTISRVVNSKYVQTQFGIILLKSLFSEAMQTESGEEVSSYEIKNILQRCIDEEDKRHPLTDETLMDILNAKGYRIARRTVAKYREMLNIPVARLRKQI